MKPIITRTIAAAAMACISAPAVTAGNPGGASSYDFQYRRSGEQQILPLQVFDNGKETYFQFSERAQVLPAILVETPEGTVVSKYHRSGPYVVIPGVASNYRLQFGSLAGAVQYAGPARQPAYVRSSELAQDDRIGVAASSTQAASMVVQAVARPTIGNSGQSGPAFGLVQPLGDGSSAPRPETHKTDVRVEFAAGKASLSADAMSELKSAVGKGEVAKVVITGRDDANFQEGMARARAIAIRAAIVKLGIGGERITMREGFMLENDDASRPSSEVTIVRAAPLSVKVVDSATPATVAEALSLVTRGIYGLVKLKSIDESRAGEIVAAVRRLVGAKDEVQPAPQLQKAEAPTVRVPEETWAMLPADETAQRGLRKWAERAGMTLDWQADVDYPISAPIVVKGSARTAISTLRDALASAKKPLTIEVENSRVVVRNQRG